MTTTTNDVDIRIRESKPAKRGISRFIPLIAVLLGAVILLYPVFATTLNNYNQQKFANEYNSDVLAIPETDREEILESARAYNATLSGIPILDPWYTKVAAAPRLG